MVHRRWLKNGGMFFRRLRGRPRRGPRVWRRALLAKSTRRGSWHSQLASSRRGSEDVLVRPRPQTSLFAPSCELALERLPRRVDLRNVAPVRLLGRLAHETNTQAAFDGKRERASLRPSSRHPRREERATLPCELRFRRCVATVGYILIDPEGVGTPAHCCDQDFRVEAKGLEPSNLLTASL